MRATTYVPSHKQVLCLWWLLSVKGAAFADSIRPVLSPTDRRLLQEAGLIHLERRSRPSKSGRQSLAQFVELSDAGWQWAHEHLDAEFSTRSPANAPILRRVLSLLKAHLQAAEQTVGEFFSALESNTEPLAGSELSVVEPAADSSSAIADVLQFVGNKSQSGTTRLRLVELRTALAHHSRDSIDRALRELEAEERIVLYPLDNPNEIRASDSQAAILNAIGQPRHILYLRHSSQIAAS